MSFCECETGFVQSAYKVFCSLLQTEIAKRLNAIIAQILPFLSQEVSEWTWLPTYRHKMSIKFCTTLIFVEFWCRTLLLMHGT
jgi:Groucho/TLE N-terminal Q-rich domain.